MGDDLDEVASLNATLEALVVRARRVKSHSLVRDAIGLKELAAVRVQLVVDDGASGRARRVAELPDEEAIESLAARVRPVVLQGDPVYWADAVKALRRLAHLRGDHMVQAELRRLKAAWKEADPNQGAGRFFQVQVRNLYGGGLAAGRDEEVTIFTATIGTPNPDPDGDFPRGWKIGLPMLLNGEDYGYSEDRPEPRA